MPTVTVIVPVRNEERSIERTLRSLFEQDYPRDQYEVIVADGCSDDETVPIVRRLQGEFANLHLTYNPQRVSSAGRNLGIYHMTGEVAVIVDGHCHIPDRNYLHNLAQAFMESGADCLGRPQPLDAPNPTRFQEAVSIARSSRLGHNPESDIFSDEAKFVPPQSTAVAYRRSVFEMVGLFDEQFDACEDVEFNHRVDAVGLTCFFSPKLKIVYDPRSTFSRLFIQLGRYGSGRGRLAAKHPKSLSLPALVPPLWAVWLVVGGIASAFVPYVGWAYFASILLYSSVIVGGSIVVGLGKPLAVVARVPLVFVGIHFGFAWGFLKETARQLRIIHT